MKRINFGCLSRVLGLLKKLIIRAKYKVFLFAVAVLSLLKHVCFPFFADYAQNDMFCVLCVNDLNYRKISKEN